ncbi:xanthine dehydrogenase [Kushneria phosphatilytica]|uniref:2Fe-2S iron-sulfur cluster binding domain-containing protein n=2 Tax=Kushneria phosphatilytica TaxID=657387 RepID=A0A1S1NSD0_9GAMM|nr:(2Fe-2S)-binding protein [Kushneria phosphatilytica]OHV07839.1 xanthine dehydrogenase [Kushneria phosphatilytica]QEL10125.1 2Fe-2S iron-sulfur cluster binding domain-containing protein [Kushneria phosphatilytica]
MADQDDYTPADEKSSSGVETFDARSPSRRRFLKSMGASGLAAATAPAWAQVAYAGQQDEAASEPQQDGAPAEGEQQIHLTVNGQQHTLNVTPNAVLLDVLRSRLGLTGTKKGCDMGQCGACTLHVNGVAVNSCLSLAVMHDGDEITTIEGLEQGDQLHPVQQAFWEHDAYQCGYCTSGQIMSAVALINDDRVDTDDRTVREAMSGNICRCGAYKNILAAIQDARGNMKGAS